MERFARPCSSRLLMRARDRAVDAGERQLRLSLRYHVRHDRVPHAAHRPAPKAQVGVVPVAQFRRDGTPLGAVVQPPDDRLDRPSILDPWPRPTDLHRDDRRFKLRPLGIGQDLHRLSSANPNHTTPSVAAASHEMRTGPRKISSICTRPENAVGFSNGCAELALKKPPPSPLNSLIASCEATGPIAISCLPPSSVFASIGAESVCGTPCQTKNSAATMQTGS